MKYQNLSARGYIVQGAKLFVTEFQHIYIRVGLFFLFVFSFSGGGSKNGFEQLAEQNTQSQSNAFVKGFESGGLVEGFKQLGLEREKQKDQQAKMIGGLLGIKQNTTNSGIQIGENTGNSATTGISGTINTFSNNDSTEESTPWGMIGFVAGFVFIFVSVFVLIGWRIGLVRGGWFAHIIYQRISGKPVSQGGSLLIVLNHSLTILKTDAIRLLKGYRPSLVILTILLIIGGYGYLQDWSELTRGFYIIGSVGFMFIGIIYGIYVSSLRYGLAKISSFVHIEKFSQEYLSYSDKLTKHRKRNLFGNLLFLGTISTCFSLITLGIQAFVPLAENRTIAIAACITTLSTSILFIASIVMFREFELSPRDT